MSVAMQDLVFVAFLLAGVAIFSMAFGANVTFWLLLLILAGMVIARWDKINAFAEKALGGVRR